MSTQTLEIESVLYCDGGMNRLTGREAWGSVVDGGGRDLLPLHSELLSDLSLRSVQLPVGPRAILVARFNDVQSQQNNGAELIAFVAALRIALHCGRYGKICCDSELITKWWSVTGVNRKTAAKMDPGKLALVGEAVAKRRQFELKGGRVVKIPGEGNLADLGFH